ncbi:peptidylprolyl isomerase [Planctomycetota bacterium]
MNRVRSRRRSATLALVFAVALVFSASGGASAGENAIDEATAKDGVYAVFETTLGTIVTRLHYEKVPVTVGNFVGLAEGTREFTDPKTGKKVKRPFYDGLIFHRVIKGFMIQGGDPLGVGRGGPGYKFMDEFDKSLRHDGPGVLSMANAGPGTNGSQFFITHAATPHLDDRHSVFGKVVCGQEVVDQMAAQPMDPQNRSRPMKNIVMNHVRIVRTGKRAKGFDAEKAFASRLEIAEPQKKQEVGRVAAFGKQLAEDRKKATTTESGLAYVVVTEGTGPSPKRGQTIVAHYTGYLEDGKKFDSSVDRGKPFRTPIGVGRVIKGWDEAFLGMKVGEKRRLIIPPELGYGAGGAGRVIPPNATLVFDVELLGVEGG